MNRRPQSLQEVADRSGSLEAWFLHVRELLDEGAFRRGRQQSLASLIEEEPKLLCDQFPDGGVADAFAAAPAALIARRQTLPVPAWTESEKRILESPWFPVVGTPALHGWLLRETPPEFKNRNRFIDERSLVRT